jgi:hypothetical protein
MRSALVLFLDHVECVGGSECGIAMFLWATFAFLCSGLYILTISDDICLNLLDSCSCTRALLQLDFATRWKCRQKIESIFGHCMLRISIETFWFALEYKLVSSARRSRAYLTFPRWTHFICRSRAAGGHQQLGWCTCEPLDSLSSTSQCSA